MRKYVLPIGVMLGVFTLAACAPAPTPTPVPPTLAPPTLVPTIARATIASATATTRPTLAPTATATATRVPPTPVPVPFATTTYAEPPQTPAFTPSKIGTVDRNVTYCIAGSVELKMDVYYPRLPATQKYPLIIYSHGGQFIKGGKFQVGGAEPSLDGAAVVAHGYALASLDYRLGPEYRLPAMYEDVMCAVRHLRARAASYNINPDRIGAIGTSSGSTLAAIMGLADPTAGFEGRGAYAGVSSRVQAVVAQFPQVAFDTPVYSRAEQESRDQSLPLNSSPEILRRLNLYTYVSADDPPFMILHGDADPALNPMLSQELNAKLVAAGVTSTFILVHNGGHGWQPGDARKPGVPYGPNPSAAEILNQELDFFDKYLKK